MKLDEYIVWKLERDDTLSKSIGDSYYDAIKDNITQRRSLVVHFITISAGIIGFTIPVIGTSRLIQNKSILIIGLSILLILIIYGFYYLKTIIDEDNNEINSIYKTLIGLHRKPMEARNIFFKEPNTENFNKWQAVNDEIINEVENRQKDKRSELDYSLDITFILFFSALVLITCSLVNLDFKSILKNQLFYKKKITQQRNILPQNKLTITPSLVK